jgi:hypothetical protein
LKLKTYAIAINPKNPKREKTHQKETHRTGLNLHNTSKEQKKIKIKKQEKEINYKRKENKIHIRRK